MSDDIGILKFGEGLLEPTLSGKKKITLRRYRAEAHSFKKGDIVQGEFKNGLNVLLRITADTEIIAFWDLTDAEAMEDGFLGHLDAFESLRTYYPDLRWEDELAIIRYEVLQIDGVPVVEMNAA